MAPILDPLGLRHTSRWWRLAALVGVSLIVVTALGLAHCSYDNDMSPDFCAMLGVPIAIVTLGGLMLSGWSQPRLTFAFAPVPIIPLDRPPEASRS